MMNNYGGKMPAQTSYGYSGAGASQAGARPNVAMYGAGNTRYNGYSGSSGSSRYMMYGVGGYYAFYMMSPGMSSYRRRYGNPEWCVVPNIYDAQQRGEVGEMMECHRCFKRYGSCSSNNDCYDTIGCSYQLPTAVNRDDMMQTGFIPSGFKAPLTVKFSKLTGDGLSEADLCPTATSETVDTPVTWTPDLYLTLTEQDFLGECGVAACKGTTPSPVKCEKNTGFLCNTTTSKCNDYEACTEATDGDGTKKWMCVCISGSCLEGTQGESDAVCHLSDSAGVSMSPQSAIMMPLMFGVCLSALHLLSHSN